MADFKVKSRIGFTNANFDVHSNLVIVNPFLLKIPFSQRSPPENIRKLGVFCFQGGQKGTLAINRLTTLKK